MVYAITDKCTGCHACLTVCPNGAVYQDPNNEKRFVIQPNRCNGCKTQYEVPQCASICPIEEAIINDMGIAFNPKGSLTGLDT